MRFFLQFRCSCQHINAYLLKSDNKQFAVVVCFSSARPFAIIYLTLYIIILVYIFLR